jgi:hypothetical protein
MIAGNIPILTKISNDNPIVDANCMRENEYVIKYALTFLYRPYQKTPVLSGKTTFCLSVLEALRQILISLRCFCLEDDRGAFRVQSEAQFSVAVFRPGHAVRIATGFFSKFNLEPAIPNFPSSLRDFDHPDIGTTNGGLTAIACIQMLRRELACGLNKGGGKKILEVSVF